MLEERNRIAREIHDTLAQGFTGIAVQLEATKRAISADAEQAHQFISKARELALHCLEQARRSIWAMRPLSLEQGDLATALAENLLRLTANTAIQGRTVVQGSAYPLPIETEEQLYRIAQEAVSNAVKYARSETIWVELLYAVDSVRLTIRDEGQGFSLCAPKPLSASGFGLISMRERAQKIGAQFAIAAEPGPGTQVTITIARPALPGGFPDA